MAPSNEAISGHEATGSGGPAPLTNGHQHVPNGLPAEHQLNGSTNGFHASEQAIHSDNTSGYLSNGIHAHPNGNVAPTPKTPPSESIAVCGIAFRLPSGLNTCQALWDFLLAKGDARGRVPESRYNVGAFYEPHSSAGTVETEYGYYLDEDINKLDTSFFSMPKKEVQRADPQQRLLLEVTRECFEDAGVANWRGKVIGCYVGSFGEDWCDMHARDTQNTGPYRATGYMDFMLSNRVSYEMDLQGPSMTVRTACSSSLVALHEACAALSRGDCEGAIVGGANLMMTPGVTIALSEQRVISPDGSCKTFSADANGYARGEAITAVYLKRTEDALRDGNPIRAIIRATATNHDGKTPGLTVPSSASQEALMRRAYAKAGITNYAETGFVECHGTGTPTGDPLEAAAVARVFGGSGMYIGSVKPNLGHTEASSGLLALIKAVLALEHRTIPPNIKFTTPNPAIPFESAKLIVPTEPTPWPSDRKERISINSFGIGGTNAHVIVEAGHKQNPAASTLHQQLLLFSANSQDALNTVINNYRGYVDRYPERAADLAYTLAHHREHLPHRAFAVVNGSVQVSSLVKSTKPPAVVMVFTGQGAQWPRMGMDLFDSIPAFSHSIRAMDKILQASGGADWTIEGELRKPGKRSKIGQAKYAQPLCTAVQIALVDTMFALGVKPDAVVGHSSGEIAAAYAAGALTAGEAITVAMHRGMVVPSQQGQMAAVGLSSEITEQYLMPGVVVACRNSPASVTISGDVLQLDAVLAAINKSHPDAVTRKLQVDRAYHSHHMREVGGDYFARIKNGFTPKVPAVSFFSTVSGGLFDDKLDASYWQRNLESPVQFLDAVSTILQSDVGKDAAFVEIGPHSALSAPLRQIFSQASRAPPYISAMVRNRDGVESLLDAIGKLYTHQIPVQLGMLQGVCLSDLPRYPWDRSESYLHESRLSREYRQRKVLHHPLLGSRIEASTDNEPSWRNMFDLADVPWVRDHKVETNVIFPFAGFVAIAGEAVRQMTGTEAFSLRHIVINTALVVADDRPTEIITTLRPQRLTDSASSSWWEFSITSHNGHTWVKHCSGLAGWHQKPTPAASASLPRRVDARQWFETLHRAGLDLGPTFRQVGDISVGTTTRVAQGTLYNRQTDKHKYPLHPTIIDSALQLMGVANAKGQARGHRNRLPVSCQEVVVLPCVEDVVMVVDVSPTGSTMLGRGCGIANGDAVLAFKGMKFTPVENTSQVQAEHSAARLHWAPDIDFTGTKDLFEAVDVPSSLDDLSQLCLVRAQQSLTSRTLERPHMQRLSQWINEQVASGTRIDSDASIDELVARLSHTPAGAVATTLQKIAGNISALDAPQQSWESLVDDNTVETVRNFVNDIDLGPFLRAMSHAKPNLRVLEIGTSSTPSSEILNHLTWNSRPLYSKYTLAWDGFISAQERLEIPNLDYITLNIANDPLQQGFEPERYDLIIARNVVHTTRVLKDSLNNLRQLLHPTGRLVLQELWPAAKWINLIYGTSPQWWIGAADDRINEPYVSKDRWQVELESSGFGSVDCSASTLNNIMVAKATTVTNPRHVTLLSHDISRHEPLQDELEGHGYIVERCTLDHTPADHDVISILDQDAPFLSEIDGLRYEALKKYIGRLKAGMFWITYSSQENVQDPRYAQVIGLARTIRSELLIDFATCEIDHYDVSLLARVFEKFQHRQPVDLVDADFEYAIRENTVHTGRFYPFSLTNELQVSEPVSEATLGIGVIGAPTTLRWEKESIPANLEGQQVEIESYAVGLNFRDILVAANIVDIPNIGFGIEIAGIVRRVGPKVTRFVVGDRVGAWGRNVFRTAVITQEHFCAKIPDHLSFDEGSTIFMPYITAWHSLIEVGRIEKGQSVLIHSACGGVGLAAIQLAQMVEADIYVTVGAQNKIDHLVQQFKIPPHRIFNSRNDSFYEGIMRETGGRGVDIILNSLAGELLHATWKCVAPFGKMIEIGKRDLLGFGKLDLNPFLANRTYTCVDIDGFIPAPGLIEKHLRTLVDLLEKGRLSPIYPIKMFEANTARDAFRYMQQGQHIGRIGVRLRSSSGPSPALSEAIDRPASVQFRSDAAYLLVGGLGGLGRAVSTWMVEQGARSLLYLSRNAGSTPEDKEFAEELQSMGCIAHFVQGSVTQAEDVHRAVAAATLPLKGIFQMSMVLNDEGFPAMTWDQWTATTSVKVQGTWNLHHATKDLDLDFMVLFSSLSGIIGQPGQANYASANTFLDAFANYRAGLGLPASVIDIGAMRDIGVVARNAGLMQKMEAAGYRPLGEQELLDAIQLAMRPSADRCMVLGLGSTIPLNSPASRAIWRRDRRMAFYHNTSTDSGEADTSSAGLAAYITQCRAEPAILKGEEAATLFATEIGRSLFRLLLKPEEDLNISLSLTELGMDSLVGVELRSWWKQAFGFDISMLEMLGMGTLEALGQHAAESLADVIAAEGGEGLGGAICLALSCTRVPTASVVSLGLALAHPQGPFLLPLDFLCADFSRVLSRSPMFAPTSILAYSGACSHDDGGGGGGHRDRGEKGKEKAAGCSRPYIDREGTGSSCRAASATCSSLVAKLTSAVRGRVMAHTTCASDTPVGGHVIGDCRHWRHKNSRHAILAAMVVNLDDPALAPPPGVTPVMSTYNPEQAGAVVCSVLAAVVPGVLLSLRMYTKLFIVRKMILTDYLAIVSYLLLISMLAVGHFVLVSGGGAHQWNLTNGQFDNTIFWIWIEEILYGPTISLVKATILLQYLSIFAPQKRVDRFMWWSAWVLIVLIAIWNLVSLFVFIFACNPIPKFWDQTIAGGSCLDYNLNITLTSLFNIVTDIMILLLPTRAVWRLHIATKRKIAISCVFAVGLLACVANSMIILYASRQTGDGADISYNVGWMGLWAFAEISLGIVVICTLTLPKFLEAKGKRLRVFLSSLTRPFSSGTSQSSMWKASKNSRSTGETVTAGGTMHSTSTWDRDRDLEMGQHAMYPKVSTNVDRPSYESNPVGVALPMSAYNLRADSFESKRLPPTPGVPAPGSYTGEDERRRPQQQRPQYQYHGSYDMEQDHRRQQPRPQPQHLGALEVEDNSRRYPPQPLQQRPPQPQHGWFEGEEDPSRYTRRQLHSTGRPRAL